MTADALERNLRLYPWLHVGHSALFWLPVFVLYFSERLGPADVLRLEAVYYAGVVLLEVPSGYLSDRLGRRPVLVVAATAWAAGSAVLAASGSFGGLALGQLLLATGMAFRSGTDTSLVYDTLVALNRPHELAGREASAQARGFATMAAAALIGGAVSGLDLRLGHALTSVVGVIAVVAAVGMVEPPSQGGAAPPLEQARALLRPLGDPVLRWTLTASIGLVVWAHVPYELLQPWLGALVDTAAPQTSGVVTFVVMGLAAVVGPRGPRLAEALGPTAAWLAAWALLMLVIGAMALPAHAALLPVVALRSVPHALAEPLLASLAHPRLPSSLRATWLSAQSLVGRLAFAAALAAASWAVGARDGWTPAAMRAVLVPALVAGIGWGLLVALLTPKRG